MIQICYYRQTTYYLRYKSISSEILSLDIFQEIVLIYLFLA